MADEGAKTPANPNATGTTSSTGGPAMADVLARNLAARVAPGTRRTPSRTGRSTTTSGMAHADDLPKNLADKLRATEQADAKLREKALREHEQTVKGLTVKELEECGPAHYDALALAGLVTFFGFHVDGMPGGRCRLYLTPQMNEFIEVAEQEVVMTKAVPESAQFPFGGTFMWVKRGADLQYTRVSSRYVQAELLSGAIAQGTAASTGADQQGNGASPNGVNGAYVGAYFDTKPQIHTQTNICAPNATTG